MTNKRLHDFFESHRQRGVPLVLATVYQTEGSTYSKSGARMLIDENGIYVGMLSGGCVEGDLAIRARVAIDTGDAQDVSFELDAGGDDLWGLGVGCDGVMRILLQRIDAESDYEPYATIASMEKGRDIARQVTVVASSNDELPAGQTVIVSQKGDVVFGGVSEATDQLGSLASKPDGLHAVTIGITETRVLVANLRPDRRLLVLGAGRDAEPVFRFAAELGWRVTVADHRPAYIDNEVFREAEETICCPAEEIGERVEFDAFDAAVVMSHHLASDRDYLAQLSDSSVGFVGLLGPAARRLRLLDEIEASESFRERVRGPVGLDLGGRGPGAIALSIVAELQQVFESGQP